MFPSLASILKSRHIPFWNSKAAFESVHPWLTESGHVVSFSLRSVRAVGGVMTSSQTTQWVRDGANSPAPLSLIFFSVSESTELVSRPRCKHHRAEKQWGCLFRKDLLPCWGSLHVSFYALEQSLPAVDHYTNRPRDAHHKIAPWRDSPHALIDQNKHQTLFCSA